MEPEERKVEEGGGSWLSELSVVTWIVVAVTVASIVAYALLRIVELFW
jgi:hypothetical protein